MGKWRQADEPSDRIAGAGFKPKFHATSLWSQKGGECLYTISRCRRLQSAEDASQARAEALGTACSSFKHVWKFDQRRLQAPGSFQGLPATYGSLQPPSGI
jgi:hypothetical protein